MGNCQSDRLPVQSANAEPEHERQDRCSYERRPGSSSLSTGKCKLLQNAMDAAHSYEPEQAGGCMHMDSWPGDE